MWFLQTPVSLQNKVFYQYFSLPSKCIYGAVYLFQHFQEEAPSSEQHTVWEDGVNLVLMICSKSREED